MIAVDPHKLDGLYMDEAAGADSSVWSNYEKLLAPQPPYTVKFSKSPGLGSSTSSIGDVVRRIQQEQLAKQQMMSTTATTGQWTTYKPNQIYGLGGVTMSPLRPYEPVATTPPKVHPAEVLAKIDALLHNIKMMRAA